MSHSNSCLNCEEPISKKFCPNCGQKTDTHRITLKHFILHDILHGIWHFERGIFFTLKEAIIRPGQASIDYIQGKRIKYYNVFYLSLLLIGFTILLNHFYEYFNVSNSTEIGKNDTPNVTKFFNENVKILLFTFVPLLGINAFLIFRRLKLNLAEHFIIGGMCLLGILQLFIVHRFFNFLSESFDPYIFGLLEVISFFLVPLFPMWTYLNVMQKRYTALGKIWRILLLYILLFVQIIIILGLIINKLTNGSGNFYISM
ncbi:DUF3667 domain-containing protein [Flavobacterium sp.]|uniref:DUF3667 domain-containing protein n=1 Tax=Flavobacterium sp. TaxID=239 RepID=UPI0026182DA5|nr:DUF3667 domain-containing protein [Flavobacterium sp.]